MRVHTPRQRRQRRPQQSQIQLPPPPGKKSPHSCQLGTLRKSLLNTLSEYSRYIYLDNLQLVPSDTSNGVILKILISRYQLFRLVHSPLSRSNFKNCLSLTSGHWTWTGSFREPPFWPLPLPLPLACIGTGIGNAV